MTAIGWELQQAVIAALQGDSEITAIANGIYDFVPETAAMPYVRAAVVSSRPWSAKTFDGREDVVRLDIWSEALSRQTMLTLMDLARVRLTTAPLTVTGATVVLVNFEFGEIIAEPDGEALHGILRFRALTQ